MPFKGTKGRWSQRNIPQASSVRHMVLLVPLGAQQMLNNDNINDSVIADTRQGDLLAYWQDLEG